MASEYQVEEPKRKRGVRRTALLLSLLAFTFYAAFIILSVLRAD